MSFGKQTIRWRKQAAIFMVILFIYSMIVPDFLLAETKITIPVGTLVTLRTTSELNPKYLNVGDRVILKVANDVKIDGKVVIAAGASARGEITAKKNQGLAGVNARIGLAVRSVEAVDGTAVSLYGSKMAEGESKTTESVILTVLCCILFLLMKGQDANIPAGTLIDCEVAGATEITI